MANPCSDTLTITTVYIAAALATLKKLGKATGGQVAEALHGKDARIIALSGLSAAKVALLVRAEGERGSYRYTLTPVGERFLEEAEKLTFEPPSESPTRDSVAEYTRQALREYLFGEQISLGPNSARK